MSGHIDDVLSLIDGGLQSSPECGMVRVLPGRCSRCVEREPVEDSGFCGPCRAFLLGDGPDPKLGSPSYFRAPDGLLILDDIDGEITVWSDWILGQATIPAPFDRVDMQALIGSVFPFDRYCITNIAVAGLLGPDGWRWVCLVVWEMMDDRRLPDGLTVRLSARPVGQLAVEIRIEWCSADPALTAALTAGLG